MGLDSVELVLAIEEEFGIDIPDRDAEKMRTVGDMYEWLKIRLSTADPQACLTQKVFHKLRRALVENYSLDRSKISPDTCLSELIPPSAVEEGWPFLQLFIDLNTPPFNFANEFLGYRLTDKTLTMREFVHALIKLNDEKFASEYASDSEIWNRLQNVFHRQLNVRPDQIVLGASITKDLGCE